MVEQITNDAKSGAHQHNKIPSVNILDATLSGAAYRVNHVETNPPIITHSTSVPKGLVAGTAILCAGLLAAALFVSRNRRQQPLINDEYVNDLHSLKSRVHPSKVHKRIDEPYFKDEPTKNEDMLKRVDNLYIDKDLSAPSMSSPIVEVSRHLLQPNGSISGDAVARAILPVFPTFASAIPLRPNLDTQMKSQEDIDYITVPSSSHGSSAGRAAVASTRPRAHLSSNNLLLHHRSVRAKATQARIWTGDRIALVLPNGPELALAILSTGHWASCVSLNAFGAHTELASDLKACGADLVIGSCNARNTSYHHVQDIAKRLDIPFIGLEPCKHKCGIFKLIVPPGTDTLVRKHRKQTKP